MIARAALRFFAFLVAAPLLPAADTQAVEKIAQLTAREHATVLFTTARHTVGCARRGKITEIDTLSAALAHDGARVAYVASGHVRIRDLATGADRDLLDTGSQPDELAWSWNDSDLAIHDTRSVSTLSVVTGSFRILISTPSPLSHLQWLHNNKDLVVEVGEEEDETGVSVLSEGRLRRLATGSEPVVSPLADRVAYYASKGVVALDVEGTGRALLTRIRHPKPGRIVWSPEGGRLLLNPGTEGEGDLSILNLRSHHTDKFLTHTAVRIIGWN